MEEAQDADAIGEADAAAESESRYNDLNDRYLRMLAEYDNYRRRSQKEREGMYPGAVADTVQKFLPLLDNFGRALEAESADESFKKGMEMIFQSLLKTFTELGVTDIGIVGEVFDANIHHAVMHIEDEALAENSVAQVMQKGYRIGDRILRCAMVSVAN